MSASIHDHVGPANEPPSLANHPKPQHRPPHGGRRQGSPIRPGSQHLRGRMLARRTACISLAATMAFAALAITIASPATAAATASICESSTERGTVPDKFPLDACVDGKSIWIRNNLTVPVTIATSGVSGIQHLNADLSLEALITRRAVHDDHVIMPNELVRFQLGSGPGSVGLAKLSAAGVYLAAKVFATYAPIPGVGEYGAVTQLVTELSQDYGQYNDCIKGGDSKKVVACRLRLEWNLGYAVGRAAISGFGGGIVGTLAGTASLLQWTSGQVAAVRQLASGPQTLSQTASSRTGVVVCSYRDPRDGHRISGSPGMTISDSGGRVFQVGSGCSLTLVSAGIPSRTCAFTDKGNGRRIVATWGSTFTDSRGYSYRVATDCTAARIGRPPATCHYLDAGNRHPISAAPGSTFTDSRQIVYQVHSDCTLSRISTPPATCHYLDAGDRHPITALPGTTFTDSLHATWLVATDCSLTIVR